MVAGLYCSLALRLVKVRCQPDGATAALAMEANVVNAENAMSVLGDGMGPYPTGCWEHGCVVSTV